MINDIIPGQENELQALVSSSFPTQSWPNGDGVGLLQFRVRLDMPPRHDTEHEPHVDQDDQTPSVNEYNFWANQYNTIKIHVVVLFVWLYDNFLMYCISMLPSFCF